MRAGYVDPDRSRRGLMTLLVHVTETAAKVTGFRTFEAMCAAAAESFPMMLGYHLVERVPNTLPDGTELLGARMRKVRWAGTYHGVMRMSFEERLGSHLKRVEQELNTAKTAAVRPAGLTVPQYAALFVLDEQPGISAAELARRCLVTPQTMTTILRNLESAALIERTPHPLHRHVIETRTTPAGRKALDAADERATSVERRLAAEFTPEERDTLRALLARVSKSLTTDPILNT